MWRLFGDVSDPSRMLITGSLRHAVAPSAPRFSIGRGVDVHALKLWPGTVPSFGSGSDQERAPADSRGTFPVHQALHDVRTCASREAAPVGCLGWVDWLPCSDRVDMGGLSLLVWLPLGLLPGRAMAARSRWTVRLGRFLPSGRTNDAPGLRGFLHRKRLTAFWTGIDCFFARIHRFLEKAVDRGRWFAYKRGSGSREP